MKTDGTDPALLDVLIVGGGFAGISAARELSAMGAKVRLLDSYSDHLGGRAYAYDAGIPAGSPLRFDHGAEYVGDAQNTIMDQIRELMPEALVNGANLRTKIVPPWEVMILNGERYCFKGTDSLFGIPGAPPQLGIVAAIGMVGMIAEMSLVEASIDVVEPWKGPDWLLALDKTDVWSWLDEKWWLVPTVKDLMRISIEALLSVEPSQISPYYLLWYTACNDGFLNEINDDVGGPQQYWLKKGTSTLAEAYAANVRHTITQGTRATTIDLRGDRVLVTTDTGEHIAAKKVIVATSPATAGKITFLPEPPPARKALMSQPMGTTLKCQVFYKEPFWRDSNGYSYDGYVGGANYPILWVMDNSGTGPEGPFVLMTFTVGEQLAKLGPNPTKDAIVTWITGTLRDLFQDERALPEAGLMIRLDHYLWTPEEPHVGGGPNTIFTPGMLTGEPGRLLDASWDDKVFFACAENARNLTPHSTSPRYDLFAPEHKPAYGADKVLLPTSKGPYFTKYSDMRVDLGYMSGAMESGRYRAHEVARSLGLSGALPLPTSQPPTALAGDALSAATTITPDHVEAVLRELREELLGPNGKARLEGFAEGLASPRGFPAFLRELVAKVLSADGNPVSANDAARAPELLRHVRDVAVALAAHVLPSHDAPPTEVGSRIAEHVSAIDGAVSPATT